MTTRTDRASWITLVATFVLLGTSIGIALGLLSPLASGLLSGAAGAAILICLGSRYRRT